MSLLEDNQQPIEGASMMARLRAKRRDAASVTTVDLPLAGYGGELVARYRLLDPLIEGREIGDQVRREFPGADRDVEREFYGTCDTLIRACVGLFVKGPKGLEPLVDEEGEMGYDHRLAAGLEIEADGTARGVLIGAFLDNKVALLSHGLQYQAWMADPAGFVQLGEA